VTAKYHTAPTHCETCNGLLEWPNYQQRRFCSRRCSNIRRWLTEQQFWERVDKTGGPDACWPWLLRLDKDGYGDTRWKGKPIRAHRLAFFFTKGTSDAPLIRHSCDNPPCCNPSHLLDGTVQDNSDDMVSRGRSLTGEENHKAVLIEPDVLVMRAMVANGTTLRDAAARFGVSLSTAASAVHGDTWRSLPGAIPPLSLGRDVFGRFVRE
jgi:endogenous inhibitor of DNA gyrase (YacG/DUF329 family)